jgi:hypothetical protein
VEKGLPRILKKQSIFWELTYWKDLDVNYSIDVMHVEKNVYESLLRTLLNTDGKTRDHGHVRANLKKMEISQELWHDDSVKGMELPTSCITLSKHEKKEFCGFLKNVKVPSVYSTNVSRLISFSDLKVAPGVKSHDYHVFSMGFSLRQHVACSLACIRESMWANKHMRARHKKHRVEHKLSEIFEALRLSSV